MSEIKRLTRSEKNKVFLGVCGGLAEYFEVDPVIVRVIFVLLALGSGFGVLLYLVLAVALPSSGESSNTKGEDRIKKVVGDVKDKIHNVASNIKSDSENTGHIRSLRNLGGIILILLGFAALLNQFFNMHWIERAILPIAIVLLGFYLIFKRQ